MTPIQKKINYQISKAFENLGATAELLAIIGSYGDTLEDDEVLDFLEQYNKTGSCFVKIICSVGDTPEDRRKRFELV